MNTNRINDRWFTIIGVSLYQFHRYTSEEHLFVPHNITDVLIQADYISGILIMWTLCVWAIKKVRKKYSDANHSLKRFFITAAVCFAISVGVNLIVVSISNFIRPDVRLAFTADNLGQYLVRTVAIIWMMAGMYETNYHQFLLKESQRQKNELLRMHMQRQLDNLKGKVSPHFLFNSLTTLSSLIYNDPIKAEQFVEELSGVYRYLLKNHEDDLATLKDEIDFITSYFILISIRFGKGLVTTIKANEGLLKKRLPAISLQLLVENAVKHNVISRERPLHIEITTEGETLVVKNNLQRKPQTLPSEKMGLNYIITKYAMVNVSGVEIDENDESFIVRLPLIEEVNNTSEQRLPAEVEVGADD